MTAPLRATDPSRLGGYRLLGRLGDGGMGAVYLGRGDAGELAAVKVVRAEHAGDPVFRERFRRETEAARRVAGPFTAAVLAADPEADRPWLATAFVPGPSLAELVVRCGPLPPRAVRVLGGTLAAALTAVHDAGLVHRDLAPANVLIGPDGPRLIDFGIARATAEAAPLTGTGQVLGTPGFLAPEQAGEGEAGPPADVFALGCVLAHAATGRPPFGTGAAEALLYRTVHDEPDLDGVDPEQARLLTRCLAKDPAGRPAAADLARELAEDLPAEPLGWLPPAMVALVAERAAELLDLPDIDATEVSDPPAAPRRRALLAAAVGGAAVLAGGGVAAFSALLGGSDDDGAAAGESSGGPVLAVHTDLTGPQAASGREQERGARLAVAEFNARADRPFDLAVRVVDDGGSPARAAEVADELVADEAVFAVIGPAGDETARAALPIYEEAGLPTLLVSPGSDVLATEALLLEDSAVLLHARPGDLYLPLPALARLHSEEAAARPAVVQDRSLGQHSESVANSFHLLAPNFEGLRPIPRVVPPGTAAAEGFGPVVAGVLDEGADSVVYVGPPDGAAALARELAAAGFTGPRITFQPVLTAEFLELAGPAAEGWLLISACTEAAATEEAAGFTAAYRDAHDADPGYFAPEAYDVAQLVLAAVADAAGEDGAGGGPYRAGLAGRLRETGHRGIIKEYAFDPETGGYAGAAGLFFHRVAEGRFTLVGPAPIAG